MNRRVAGVLAVVGSASIGGAVHGQFTWTALSGGAWSDPTRWLNGNAPPAGGSSTALVGFQSNGYTPWIATNDLAGPFAMSGLILASTSPATTTVAGSQLQFMPGGLVIRNAPGSWVLSNPVSLGGSVSMLGGSLGEVRLTGVISGPGSISCDVPPPPSPLAGPITIGGTSPSTYSGGTTLNTGTLLLSGAQPLGTGTVTINGGTLGAAGSVTLSNTFVLNSTLNFAGSGQVTLTGPLTGPGGFSVRNQGSVDLLPMIDIRSACTHAGPTVLQHATMHTSLGGSSGNPAISAPRMVLSHGGTLLSTSAIGVQGGGALTLDDSAVALQRLNADAPVTLSSAELSLIGNGLNASSQQVGAIIGRGSSSIVIAPGASGARITAASLSRADDGVVMFRAPGLGGPVGPGSSNVFFVTQPALVGGDGFDGQSTKAIMPYAVGSYGSVHPTDLVTYGVDGVRLLVSSEYQPFLGWNQTDNVRLVPGVNNDNAVVINALVTEGSVTGSGSISITSGIWLSSPTVDAPQTMSNTVDMGTGGQIITGGVNAPAVTMAGVLGGHNIAKAGLGTLSLTNPNNTMTGTLSVFGGVVSFSAASQLGNIDSIRGLHASPAPALQYSGPTATVSKNIVAAGGHFRIASVTANAALTLSGVISGPGGLQTFAAGTSGSIVLTGTNTYTGGTRIANGDLVFSSDANLGAASGGVDLGTDSTSEGIRLVGDWTSGRALHVSMPSRINTQNYNATLSGTITGTAGVTKTGAGTLTLNGPSTHTGTITVGQAGVPGGSLLVNNASLFAVTVVDGLLGGDGIVGAVSLTPTGTVSPGNTTGSLDVRGPYFQGGGTLRAELAGTGDYDQLIIAGPATLSGTLNVPLINGFQPAPGSSFTILTAAGGVSGTFATTSLPQGMTITYAPNSVTLSLPGAVCDSVDFNGDTLFPDTQDIADFLTVFAGGPCPTGTCGDVDFNNDTLFPDTLDIQALLSVFSGGPCLQ
ncbi:MAG: autotransporter-associated beta strand repeat-containing protein [Phycisphaerales bacterium]